jgi:hypothetical protein
MVVEPDEPDVQVANKKKDGRLQYWQTRSAFYTICVSHHTTSFNTRGMNTKEGMSREIQGKY